MEESQQTPIHIPEGINYSCTGCGKCCGEWSVPLTEADYERISAMDWSSQEEYRGKKLFSTLSLHEKEGLPFTHVIVATEEGYCPFLKDHLCVIHAQHGPEAKPQTCQLFPYTFTQTPTGAYATVSMVSLAAMYNVGTPLSDQESYLRIKLDEYEKVMSAHAPDWSHIQLVGGQKLDWPTYLEYEEELLSYLKDKSLSLDERLLRGSTFLISKLDKPQATIGTEPSALKKLDRHLLSALHKIYLPHKPPTRMAAHFNTFRLIHQYIFLQPEIRLKPRAFTIEELQSVNWPADDAEIEDMLYRYLYQRIFGKFYFGGGFAQITLITGYHHLILVYALIKLHAKAIAFEREAQKVSLDDVAETIRLLEKYLGQTHISGYAAAAYELLMFSPQRIRRVLANS